MNNLWYRGNERRDSMGTLEQTKVIQAMNRLEDIRCLLNEVSKQDTRYERKFAEMNTALRQFGEELQDISEQMLIENLGKND